MSLGPPSGSLARISLTRLRVKEVHVTTSPPGLPLPLLNTLSIVFSKVLSCFCSGSTSASIRLQNANSGRWNSRPSVSALHCELLEDSLKDASVHRVHHRARPQEVFNRCATSYLSRSLIEHLSVLDPGLSTLYHFLIESSE